MLLDVFFFKQQTAYEVRISDWSSDVCSSDLSMLGACALLAACGPGQEAAAPPAEPGYQKVLQQQLLDAKPGDVIEIPAGRHALDRSLSLRVDGVTIRGADRKSTRLNSSH